MCFVRTALALTLLGSLAGCYPPTQTAYDPAVVEQPQPVHFFYGRLIDERPASLEYGYETGIGATLYPRWPLSVGLHFGGNGSDAGARFSAGIVDVLAEASVPNFPAVEYTVMLDNGTNPPDPFLAPQERAAAVVVVQNLYPTDRPLEPERPCGRSGRRKFGPGDGQPLAARCRAASGGWSHADPDMGPSRRSAITCAGDTVQPLPSFERGFSCFLTFEPAQPTGTPSPFFTAVGVPDRVCDLTPRAGSH